MTRKIQRELALRYKKTHPKSVAGERVYVAAPKSIFLTRKYEESLSRLRKELPEAQLLEARALYSGSAAWRRDWPHYAEEITGLVFLVSIDNWIGRGVWREVMDIRARSRPIHLLGESGLVPFDALAFSHFDYADFQRFVRCHLLRSEA